jgi:hypothetical protein
MNIINFNFKEDKYLIHVIDSNNYNYYEEFISNVNICNKKILSKSFEQLAYNALNIENQFIGFFLTNKTNNILFATIIVDLTCEKNKEIIIEQNASLENSVEITLICSNENVRVVGLTNSFTNYVISTLIPNYKLNVESIYLYVAGGQENTIAMKFYNKLGFRPFDNEILVYNYLSNNFNAKGINNKIYKKKYIRKKTNKHKYRQKHKRKSLKKF